MLRGELGGGGSKGRRGFSSVLEPSVLELCDGVVCGLCFRGGGSGRARDREKGKRKTFRSEGRELEPGQRIGLSTTLSVPQLRDEEIDVVERPSFTLPLHRSLAQRRRARPPPRGTPCRGRGRRSNATALRASCGPAAAPTMALQPTTHPTAVPLQTSPLAPCLGRAHVPLLGNGVTTLLHGA